MSAPPRRIPGWFVALIVLVTAAITIWAMLRKRGGQQEDWPGDPTTLPQRVTQVLAPAVAGSDPSLRQIAAQVATPPRQPMVIRAGSTPPHTDRGACTLCHIVVDKLGAVVPAIRAMSNLPHPYRGGICTNCHQVTPAAPATPAMPGIAPANPAALTPGAIVAPTLPQGAAQNQPAPVSEGSWMGAEVVPITSITATQYKLPAGQTGVVVAEAEGAAGTLGLQAGDVLTAVNGVAIVDMQSFLKATQGQTSGIIDVLRGGKMFRSVLGQGSAPLSGGGAAASAPRSSAGGGAPPVVLY